MTLSDGRVLAYTDLGGVSSPVVMYFHGAPTSRLDHVPLDETLAELDVRMVSPDRPGYGGSSPKPGRRLEDWPPDVAALADQLGIDRFAVMALSSGGPYAVACAALLPDRVVGAGVVSGVTDFGWAGAWDDYLEDEMLLMRLGDESKARAWCETNYGTDATVFVEGGLDELSPSDRAALAELGRTTSFLAALGEALRQGVGGYAQDVVVQGRAWPFDAAAITAPVWVLHAEADTVVPVAHARHTAELIPGARLLTWPDRDHLGMLAEVPQLAADLAAPLR